MVSIKCDMCGKDILNDRDRISISFPHETSFTCYDLCEECSNRVEEFIKARHNKCNREYCEGCEHYQYASSILHPNKLITGCIEKKNSITVNIDYKVKPKDFNEEET